jgi:hypothetical protein
MSYFLWKDSRESRNFAFLPYDELPNFGYSSIYGVSREDADAMLAKGSYAGFTGVLYPSEYLYIDCDKDEEVEAVESKLSSLKIGFLKVDSGNRGAHFYVLRKIAPSVLVPLADKLWVAKTFGSSCDLKLYSPLHLLRRIGHKHEKTGRLCTQVLACLSKEQLTLDTYELELSMHQFKHSNEYAGQSVFANRKIIEMSVPYFDGERHASFPLLAKLLFETGNPLEFTIQWLRNVNMLGDPLDDSKIVKLAKWAHGEKDVYRPGDK